MRALTISAHGAIDRLELRDDVPIPALTRPTDVRVRLHASALNHLDLFVVAGLPGVTITPPWIPGGDGAGEIEEVGSSVTGFAPGDRVLVNPGVSCRACEYCLAGEQPLCPRFRLLGEHLPGTLAEYVVVPAANLRPVPRGVSMADAAAYTLATLTAWRMVVTRAQLRAGETVLIQGIGGGVALQALLIAKLIGARVWVTSRSESKLARARTLGAEETFDSRTMDVAREVRARTNKRGVDVVLDNVGEATWSASLGALGRRGRLVTCGGTTGPMVTTDVRRLFWNQWSILGSTMGNDAELDAIVAALADGRLHPIVDSVYDLADARSAFERLASGEQFGKVVVRIRE